MQFDQQAGHCLVSNFRLHLKFWPWRKPHLLQPMISQTQLDSSPISSFTVITSLSCSIHIDVSPQAHCGTLSFPAYRGSALVKNFAIRSLIFGLHSPLTPLTLGTFTTRILNEATATCLYSTRVCDFRHYPSFSNSEKVSGPHLACSNKTGCWSSFFSFVANVSSAQFWNPFHLPSYSYWLCLLILTWISAMLSGLSPTSCGLIDHRAFFTDSTKRPPMLYVFTTKRVRQMASV